MKEIWDIIGFVCLAFGVIASSWAFCGLFVKASPDHTKNSPCRHEGDMDAIKLIGMYKQTGIHPEIEYKQYYCKKCKRIFSKPV